MELNKSFLLTILVSSFLVASIDAHPKPKPEDCSPPPSTKPSAPAPSSKTSAAAPSTTPSAPAPSTKTSAAAPSTTIAFAPAPSPISVEIPAVNLPNLPPPKKVDPRLRYVCGATDNIQKCVALIAPHLKGTANVASVLKAIVGTLRAQILEASKVSKEVRDDEQTSHEMMAALDTSVELYDEALGSVSKASTAFKNMDLHRFQILLGAAISNLGYCNEAYEKKGFTTWPLKETNEMLIELAGYGVDISTKFSKYVAGNAQKKI